MSLHNLGIVYRYIDTLFVLDLLNPFHTKLSESLNGNELQVTSFWDTNCMAGKEVTNLYNLYTYFQIIYMYIINLIRYFCMLLKRTVKKICEVQT